MCGRYAQPVELEDFPEIFNQTVVNRGGSENQLHQINPNRFESRNSKNQHYQEQQQQQQQQQQQGGHAKGSDIVEIEILRPQPNQLFSPSYNIPPTGRGIIIYQKPQQSSKNATTKYYIESLTFGLVPNWAKPTDTRPVLSNGRWGAPYTRELQRYQGRQFNCRKESLGGKDAAPTWKAHKSKFRCVVPIKGYYEWHKTTVTNVDKTPYFVYSLESPIIYLAGLYSHNYHYQIGKQDEYFSSFTIVTGPARENDIGDLSWLHARKPIMLTPGTPEWFDWLDPSKEWDEVMMNTILNTENNAAYSLIVAHPVGRKIGQSKSEGEDLIKKVTSSPQKSITLFFHKSPKKDTKEEVGEEFQREVKKEVNEEVESEHEGLNASPVKRRKVEGSPADILRQLIKKEDENETKRAK